MKISKENIYNLPIDDKDRGLLKAIISDMDEINEKYSTSFYIDFQDYHDECSPEWVDPCPDYYGYYTIRNDKIPFEICGTEMTLEDLDYQMVLFNDVIEIILGKKEEE